MKRIQSKSQKAITLVALVITIIILLILAGISILTLAGDNGLLNKVKETKEKTLKAELKEEIELAIMEIQTEYLQKGTSVTLDIIKTEIPIINSLKENISNVEKQGDIVNGVYKGYNFEIDSNYKVTIGNKFKGILFSYELSPEGYTNEYITLTIKLTGDGQVEGPEDSASITKINDRTYKISENGEYEFKIKDNEGNTIDTKTIYINKIDKELPATPTIEINKDTIKTNKFMVKIVNEEQDNEGGSGIKEYGYFVAKGVKTEYTEYKSSEKNYTVNGLERKTKYTVYVIAYDKAGNQSEKSNVLEVTTIDNILDYAIITEDGIMNCIDDDGNYYFDKTMQLATGDALGIEAYDGMYNTYVSMERSNSQEIATKYINVDSNMWNKELYFYVYYDSLTNIYIYFYDENDKFISSDALEYTQGIKSTKYLIPKGTKKIGFAKYFASNESRIIEISQKKFDILDYAIITEDGIMNCIDDDGNYYLNKTVQLMKSDALGVEAYDGMYNTYVSMERSNSQEIATKYINVDSNMWNKELYFYVYYDSLTNIYIYFYDENDKFISSDALEYTQGIKSTKYIIPKGTKKIGFAKYFASNESKIIEMALDSK